MSWRPDSLWLACLLGWVAFAFGQLALAPDLAAKIGGVVAVIALTWPRGVVMRALLALFEPVGVVLPLLAARDVAQALGWEMRVFSTPELIAFLIAFLVFLAASTGRLGFDPYRLGYAPLPAGAIALLACIYGAAVGDLFVPLLAVTAQMFWLLRWGSSNYFDHILHALLVPIAVIALIARLLGG